MQFCTDHFRLDDWMTGAQFDFVIELQ